MIDEAEARAAVDAVLADWPPPAEPDRQVVVWKVEEYLKFRAWLDYDDTDRPTA